MSSTVRPVVFMDVNIGETPAGRLKMELFSDIVPKFVAISMVCFAAKSCPKDGGKFPAAVYRRVQVGLALTGGPCE
jgi:hypothetical protein